MSTTDATEKKKAWVILRGNIYVVVDHDKILPNPPRKEIATYDSSDPDLKHLTTWITDGETFCFRESDVVAILDRDPHLS